MSANGGAGWILLLLLVSAGWKNTLSSSPERNVTVDIGDNVTISCFGEDGSDSSKQTVRVVKWIRKGREDGQIQRLVIEPNGALNLYNVTKADSSNYMCTFDDEDDNVQANINVVVRTPPPALHNVWIKPSTILAYIMWEVGETGGHPIIDFTAEYRLKTNPGEDLSPWKPIIPNHIPPNSRQIDVYHLEPNTTYIFRIWATNKLGKGEIVEVEGHTHHSVEELELARHLLAGVENFDTRWWLAAVGIVMGTLLILGLGTCFLLYRECKTPSHLEEQEVIELVPNIILNPGFFDDRAEQQISQDENSQYHNQMTRLNNSNNTAMQPRRL